MKDMKCMKGGKKRVQEGRESDLPAAGRFIRIGGTNGGGTLRALRLVLCSSFNLCNPWTAPGGAAGVFSEPRTLNPEP